MIQVREEYPLYPIGRIRSTLRSLDEAPRQGSEGAPDAWLEVKPAFARGLGRIAPRDEVIGTPVVDVKAVLGESSKA